MPDISSMPWWEREKLLTPKDKEAINRAKQSDWTMIEEDWAETEAGRLEVHDIMMSKYHREEYQAGIL